MGYASEEEQPQKRVGMIDLCRSVRCMLLHLHIRAEATTRCLTNLRSYLVLMSGDPENVLQCL